MFTFPICHFSSSAFLPTSLAGLALWLDGADASSITLGTGVSQWSDKSGLGHHATNATGSAQPTYVSNVQNGQHAVHFNGAQSLFANLAISQPYTAFYVSWSQAADGVTALATNPNTIFELKDLVGGHLIGFHFTHFAGAENLVSRYDGATRVSPDCTYNATTAAEAFELRSDLADTTSAKIYQGGTLKQTQTSTLASPNTSTQMQIGSEYGGNFMLGYICELILYSRIVNSTEQGQVEGYLRAKWGTA